MNKNQSCYRYFPHCFSGGVEQRVSYLLASSVDSEKVEEVIYTLVSEMQHHRESTITTIPGKREKQGSPYARLQEKSFPVLQRFGIPIDDARVHENIFRELFRISQIFLQTSTMYLTLEDNKRRGFIMVPKSSSLYRMRRNDKRLG